ncbi:plasmid partitioning protein RepB C-terminal domain-containing protein [Mesorhizobium sp. Root172]|uniref:plasmid partitioning protein RepB C-terminal domain-containing protein n=1 Tax=Mesorhizobium sp. Root172 TaxID=1736481 RepID=UPI0009E772DC|nr:plasmid partitioning protein RepB C-terminal domain-containing protein [Mesorhizobium sp. Root172]
MRTTKAELRHFVTNNRHAIRLTVDSRAPMNPLRGPGLLKTYRRQVDNMKEFIGEADAVKHQMESVVDAFRHVLRITAFQGLLQSSGFATLPSILTQNSPDAGMKTGISEDRQNPLPRVAEPLVEGICLEALDRLKDFGAPLKIFGLLRDVVPGRQVEIVRLMLAMDRVQFRVAKVLIELTPRSQLTNPLARRKRYEGISSAQMAAMEADIAEVSHKYLSAASTHGSEMLNLIAATNYFDRLLNNPKLVRYLARNFTRQLEVFQNLLDFREARYKNPPTA